MALQANAFRRPLYHITSSLCDVTSTLTTSERPKQVGNEEIDNQRFELRRIFSHWTSCPNSTDILTCSSESYATSLTVLPRTNTPSIAWSRNALHRSIASPQLRNSSALSSPSHKSVLSKSVSNQTSTISHAPTTSSSTSIRYVAMSRNGGSISKNDRVGLPIYPYAVEPPCMPYTVNDNEAHTLLHCSSEASFRHALAGVKLFEALFSDYLLDPTSARPHAFDLQEGLQIVPSSEYLRNGQRPIKLHVSADQLSELAITSVYAYLAEEGDPTPYSPILTLLVEQSDRLIPPLHDVNVALALAIMYDVIGHREIGNRILRASLELHYSNPEEPVKDYRTISVSPLIGAVWRHLLYHPMITRIHPETALLFVQVMHELGHDVSRPDVTGLIRLLLRQSLECGLAAIYYLRAQGKLVRRTLYANAIEQLSSLGDDARTLEMFRFAKEDGCNLAARTDDYRLVLGKTEDLAPRLVTDHSDWAALYGFEPDQWVLTGRPKLNLSISIRSLVVEAAARQGDIPILYDALRLSYSGITIQSNTVAVAMQPAMASLGQEPFAYAAGMARLLMLYKDEAVASGAYSTEHYQTTELDHHYFTQNWPKTPCRLPERAKLTCDTLLVAALTMYNEASKLGRLTMRTINLLMHMLLLHKQYAACVTIYRCVLQLDPSEPSAFGFTLSPDYITTDIVAQAYMHLGKPGMDHAIRLYFLLVSSQVIPSPALQTLVITHLSSISRSVLPDPFKPYVAIAETIANQIKAVSTSRLKGEAIDVSPDLFNVPHEIPPHSFDMCVSDQEQRTLYSSHQSALGPTPLALLSPAQSALAGPDSQLDKGIARAIALARPKHLAPAKHVAHISAITEDEAKEIVNLVEKQPVIDTFDTIREPIKLAKNRPTAQSELDRYLSKNKYFEVAYKQNNSSSNAYDA